MILTLAQSHTSWQKIGFDVLNTYHDATNFYPDAGKVGIAYIYSLSWY